jgi:hypothetical protein
MAKKPIEVDTLPTHALTAPSLELTVKKDRNQ